MSLSTEKLVNYLHTVFISSTKEEIKDEIENNEPAKNGLTLFVKKLLSSNAVQLSEEFPKFQKFLALKDLKFFKKEDIDKLPKREIDTIRLFKRLYQLSPNDPEKYAEYYNGCIGMQKNKTGYPPYFNARDEKGFTLLMFSVQNDKKGYLTRHLFNEEPNFQESKHHNWTLFWHCIIKGTPETLKIIFPIQKGIEWPTIEKSLKTPLHLAVFFNNIEIIKCLIDEYHFPIHQLDGQGKTALENAIQLKLLAKNPKAYDECIKILREKEQQLDLLKQPFGTADFNVQLNGLEKVYQTIANNDTTRLHFSVSRNDSHALSVFLNQENQDFNVQDTNERTPLVLALENENFPIAKQFFENDPSILKDPKNLSALLLQVINMKSWKTFRYLIGLDSIDNKCMKEAIESISKDNKLSIKKQLLIKTFLECCDLRDQFFQLMKEYNIDKREHEPWEKKPLLILSHYASEKSDEKEIEKRIEEYKRLLAETKLSLLRLREMEQKNLNKEPLSVPIELAQKAEEIETKTKNSITETIRQARLKIFRRSSLESISKTLSTTKQTIKQAKTFQKNELETLRENLINKELEPQTVLEIKLTQELHDSKKVNEILKKENEKLKKENETIAVKEKEIKFLLEELKKLKKLLKKQAIFNNPVKFDPNDNEKIDFTPSESVPETATKSTIFIKPKNDSLTALKECILDNCKRLSKIQKYPVNFEKLSKNTLQSMKKKSDLVNFLALAGFTKEPSNGGSHDNWQNNGSEALTVCTHKGDDNSERQIKSAFEKVIDVLKKCMDFPEGN